MRVLFVCTGNTGRSLMAENIFNHIIREHTDARGKSLKAISAGVDAIEGDTPEEYAVKALQERGIIVRDHKAKKVTPKLLDSVDIILTMGQRHREKILMMNRETRRDLFGRVFILAEFAGEEGNIMDCYGHDLEFYRKCADRLDALIERVIKKLTNSIR